MYGWVSLGIMATLLAGMWLRIIPESLYLVMFIIAASLFSGRIILRVLLLKQKRQPERNTREA